MPAFKCVRAVPADARTLGRLHSLCWREAYRGIILEEYLAEFTEEKRTAFFVRILPMETGETYLLYVDDEAVGLLGFGKAHDEEVPPSTGEIHALYLLSPYWSKGFGKAAMDFAMERLRMLGYDRATLKVLTENGRARQFYARYGFVPGGEEEPITLGRELMELRYEMSL